MNRSYVGTYPYNEGDSDTPNLAYILNTIFRNRWMIVGITLMTAILAGIYAYSKKPVYEASVLIQVKEATTPGKDFPGRLPAVFDLQTQASTEMEILRSRAVLSPAVDALRLDIVVEPKYFPVIGALLAKASKQISAMGIFGLEDYVRGAEKASISVFNIPEGLKAREFALRVQDKGKFILEEDDLEIRLEGTVGQISREGTAFGDIEILVDSIEANPGTQFSVIRFPKSQAIDKLQKELEISEKGRKSNIIGVSLKGTQPELISNILNEMANEYIRQNIAQKSQEAEKSLSFFKQQLAESKQNLDRSEARFAEIRSKRGTFDVNDEARTLLQQSVALQAQLAEMRQTKEELLLRYMEGHPSVALINKQIDELNKDLRSIKSKIQMMPALEKEITDATRDRMLNTEMYTGILNMGRQLGMVETDRIANVRLLDRAETPLQPVTLKRSIMVALAILAGAVIGVIGAFLKNMFRETIHDPHDIEQSVGIMVSAIIPHSKIQRTIHKKMRRNSREVLLLSQNSPIEGAIESMRTFRSTLQFLMRNAQRNIIMITGPTSGVGKSFISANFASILASTGKKVLLVDGDMRTGCLHHYFGLARTDGLADLLSMTTDVNSVIHKKVVENVDLIAAGSFPDKPAELLAHANFGKLLHMLSAQYDYILIDAAAVLEFSDALIIGSHADAIFSVVRDGISSLHEAEECIKRMNRTGLTATGFILNDVKPALGPYKYVPRYRSGTPSLGYQDSDAEKVRLIVG